MSDLRPMYMSDLPRVLQIINTYDDEDGEAAEADFHDSGFDHQYVIEQDERVVGVTGYRMVEATDQTAWLSWTYLDPKYCGQGLGKKMVNQLIEQLTQAGGRKLFVKVSDYVDPENGSIYERAFGLYQALGFVVEVTSDDFYDDGESQRILGLTLTAPENEEELVQVQEERPNIRFNGMHEIAETDGAYTFEWTVDEGFKLFGKKSFSRDDLIIGLQAVKEQGGRKVFLTFPSNLVLIHQSLQAAGFQHIGQLTDYYEVGIHEMHFSHDLTSM